MLNRDDVIEIELNRQKDRLGYLKAVLAKSDTCPQPPRRVFFEPTNICNLNCAHCVHDGKMTRQRGSMDLDLYRSVIHDIRDWNRRVEICLFQQGEPLLHKDIAEMVRIAATEYDFFTKMNTNGVALTPELSEQLIRNRLDYLVFSLDAMTPATYEAVKRKPHFHKVIGNILDYLEIWGDLDTGFERSFFAPDVNLLMEKANSHEIPMAKEMFAKLPVGHVAAYELHNYMGAVEEANSKLEGVRPGDRSHWPCCNTPWDLVGIRWNGDVVACIYDYDSRYVIGNVKEESLKDIWNGERMRAFRRALLDREFSCIEGNGPLCSECSILWMKDYQLPTDYYCEIARMERYLAAAVDRVASRHPRTEELLKRHAWLKANRDAWMRDLRALEDVSPAGGAS